ncbi:TPA_asm: RNA-directed RNA polymerase [ssRNA phage Esthiorhiza.1_2]|uniref:RNA-directed RNA polymerase n=2 Tax=Leviviricetes TaxID=2842243 RepID=A0A8S5L448_9VIRU|nr:RNA-directed RNA polymerase [ssRNA phage Esthiorhiza.1_2]QDH88288.1 MAG: RNA-dependent RNA polymerase [Leviviridae sp.]DAD51962.1 TPA_asm: RNA-directed RNA polymerase [ssRNA phage Esthiorhiza.1_2]
MKSPIALLASLVDDFTRLNPGVKGLKRDLVTLGKRFENEGYGFLTVALPALDEALLRGLSSGQFTCPYGFKTTKGGTIPLLFSGMFCKVFDPLTGLLVETPDLGVLKDLRTVLRLFKKARLSAENEDILHTKAVNEFYQCDVVASGVIIPDRHSHLIGRVCKLLLNSLNSKEVEYAKYRHGPGAVKEGYKANQKWQALYNSLWEEEEWIQPFGIWGIGESHNPSSRTNSGGERIRLPDAVSPRVVDRGATPYGVLHGQLARGVGLPSVNRASRSSAKLISVPKNSTSRRTITVEPMLNQFVQQGLNTLLRESISECRVLRNCIALSDQSLNQKLALEGSLFDNWATIDLKSASDLLSVKLVESVFRHHNQFLGHMMDCRSPLVECESKPTITLGKFAGMGNALTFPVQSVCFAVVCIAAILDSEGTTPTYWNVRRASRRIRVYGDDIIVQRKYAHQCVEWLHSVGLKVNVKKSFLVGNFKESCGVDAFRGVDVTPLYIKHRPDQSEPSPSVIAGFVSLSNHMWMEGLYTASTYLKDLCESLIGKRLPLVSKVSGSLGWHSRLDAMTPHKWCRHTHRFLTRTLALAPIKRDDKLNGYASLLKCLSLARDNIPREDVEDYRQGRFKPVRDLFPEPLAMDEDHLVKTTMRYKSRIRARWVPTLVG